MKKVGNSDFTAYDLKNPLHLDGASLARKFRDAIENHEAYFGVKLENGTIRYIDVAREELNTYLEEVDEILCDKETGSQAVKAAAGQTKEAVEKALRD